MPASSIKLVCFDLDCTILNGRINRSLEEAGEKSPLSRDTLEFYLQKVDGIKNPLGLRKTIKDLLKNNIQVAVTSFCAHPEVIPFVLEKIGLTADEIARVKDFSTRPDQARRYAHGKNDHLERAIAGCGCDIRPEEVVLVDDNINNYLLANHKGYNVIWVQGSQNDVSYLNELREMTGLAKTEAYAPRAVVPKPQAQSWLDKILSWFKETPVIVPVRDL